MTGSPGLSWDNTSETKHSPILCVKPECEYACGSFIDIIYFSSMSSPVMILLQMDEFPYHANS